MITSKAQNERGGGEGEKKKEKKKKKKETKRLWNVDTMLRKDDR